MKINLGCGDKRVSGFLGVDRYRAGAVELLCDIERSLPLRFELEVEKNEGGLEGAN